MAHGPIYDNALRLLAATDLLAMCRWPYLRDHHPDEFLTEPALAPLAVLGKTLNRTARVEVLRKAFAVLTEVDDLHRREDLAGVAAVLAAIHLDAVIIERLGREAGMPITLEDTVGGRSLAAQAEARGQAMARVELLAGLLRRRFGCDPRVEECATRLAPLPQEEILDAVLAAGSLDELVARYPAAGE